MSAIGELTKEKILDYYEEAFSHMPDYEYQLEVDCQKEKTVVISLTDTHFKHKSIRTLEYTDTLDLRNQISKLLLGASDGSL